MNDRPYYLLEAVSPMTFESILFIKTGEGANKTNTEVPPFFVDLNLNQIIDAVTAERDIYDLQPFFYTPVQSEDAIQYRHEIMQELNNDNFDGRDQIVCHENGACAQIPRPFRKVNL